jgi:proline iminopeptidase
LRFFYFVSLLITMTRPRFSSRTFGLLLAALLLLVKLTVVAAPAPHSFGGQRAVLPDGPLAFRTSDSVQLFVKIAGRGVPCLVVHGGPGAGSYGLEHLGLQPLESSMQLIYLDQRGSGRSASSPRHNYALARQVQDLEELRQRLGLRQWVLLAHSFGGVIATAYAQRYPEHVQALVLVNAVLNPTASLESMVHYGDSLLPAAARPQLPPTAPLPQHLGAVMQALGQQKLLYQLPRQPRGAAAAGQP